MAPFTSAVREAADRLQRITEATAGERGRRGAVLVLVLRAVERLASGGAGDFLRRRAEAELEGMGSSGEPGLLRRLLLMAAERGEAPAGLLDLLVGYACELESTRRLPEADVVLGLARRLGPGSAEVALHSGRLARMRGDTDGALRFYALARELDGAGGAIGRLAAVGQALVSAAPEQALARVLRGAVTAADQETAAVALEERARIRRSSGKRAAAARDLCLAAARYPDAVDRGRVAHQLADLCVSGDDARGAREALLIALVVGDPTQRDHARNRLHTISRDLGDQLGARRWRSFERPTLVSLSSRRVGAAEASLAGFLVRWRSRAEEWRKQAAASGC